MTRTRQRSFSVGKTAAAVIIALAIAVIAAVAGGGTAFAYNDFGLNSASVIASHASGMNSGQISVTLTVDGAEGAKIYYTLDGTTPTTSSTEYTGAITVGSANESKIVTLKAIAAKDGMASEVSTYTYEILHNLAKGKSVELVNGATQNAGGDYILNNSSGAGMTLEHWYASIVDGSIHHAADAMQYKNNAEGTTYVQIDLGETTTVNRFWYQTNPYGNIVTNLEIQVSTDGETFTSAFKQEGDVALNAEALGFVPNQWDSSKKFIDKSFEAKQARYIRIIAGENDKPVKLSSFLLFNCDYDVNDKPEVLDPNVPLSVGKKYELVDGVEWGAGQGDGLVISNSSGRPVSLDDWYGRLGASDLQNANYVASYANNDDRSTYVQLDLGKNYLVNHIIVHNNPITPESQADITDLKLMLSQDGENWTTIYEKEGLTEWNRQRDTGNSTLHGNTFFRYFDLVISSQTARYLRYQSGKAGEHPMLTNLMVYGYAADAQGSWQKPEDVTVSYDSIVHAADILAMLAEKHPSATFTATNGYIGNFNVTWEGEQNYTDDDLKAGGTFTYYGAIPAGSTFPDGVSDPYNAAAVAKVTLNKPSVKAIEDLIAEIDGAILAQNRYTVASYTAYSDARSAAESVKNNAYSTPAEIASAADDLRTAYNALDVLADKTALNAYITQVENTAASGYIAGSYNAFKTALDAAKALSEAANPGQKEVDDALETLKTTHAALLTVDKAQPLQAAISAAETAAPESDENKYTPATWAAYAEKLAAAKAAVTGAATQSALDTAKSELESAAAALAERGDKTELNEAIERAEAINENGYTAGSYAALADALDAAKEVSADVNATESDVTDALTTLNEKLDALVAVGDKTELNNLIASYGDGSKYTATSWLAFASVLDGARMTAALAEASPEEVAAAVAALKEGEPLLVLRGDKTELNALLGKTIDSAKYSQSSMAAYNKAKTDAQAVADDADASQADVEKAVADLKKAESELVAVGDKTALNALISECNDLVGGDYSAATLDALKTALDEAKGVAADSQASQEKIDAAVAKLTAAKDGLKKDGGCGCGGSVAASSAVAAVLVLALAAGLALVRKPRKA